MSAPSPGSRGELSRAILQLGIRANLGQFLVQTLLVFFVGITIGLERNVVPVLAEQEFAVASTSVVLSFVVSFGFVKALLNLYGGYLSESWGRRPVLIMGWLAAIPVPLLIIWAPSWWWIVGANALLGVNQGLAWSMTVTAKMDLVGSRWRGLATGINECGGYTGVAVGALATSYLAGAYGLRPAPFYFGLGVILAATGIAVFWVRETLPYARGEALPPRAMMHVQNQGEPSFREVFWVTTWRNRTLFAVCQAGLVNKFADALVWVSFPLFFLAQGLGVEQIGLLVGVYGFTWGILQLLTGPLADRWGRRWPIISGLLALGVGVACTPLAQGMAWWLMWVVLLGAGMALLYPTLLAVVGDVAPPQWRGPSLGVYRMWRDSGYAFGALLIGLVSDLWDLRAGFFFTAALMGVSALIVLLLLRETAPQLAGRRGMD